MRNEIVRSNILNTSVRVGSSENSGIGDIAPLHYHDEIEFLRVLKGEIVCTVYDKKYVAGEGDVVFVNSRVPHSTSTSVGVSYGLLQFRESEFSDNEMTRVIKYSVRFQSQMYCPVKIFSSKELCSVIDEILKETREAEKSYDVFVKSGIYKILGMLYREDILSDAERMYKTREVQKIIPILSYINNNYAENLTLESVSAQLGFDQSYFCRIFKTATGATFTEYLNFVRICKAEKLLLKTHDSILCISEAVGFSSVSYFNRIFKRYRNCSPRLYRTLACSSM